MITFLTWLFQLGLLVGLMFLCAELFKNGHFGSAVVLLVGGLSYLFEKMIKETQEELKWMAGAITDDTERKGLQIERCLYWISINKKVKIKRGMTIQEFAKAMSEELKKQVDASTALSSEVSHLEWLSEQRITNTDEDSDSIKNATLCYHNYGKDIPTPVVKFKFKNWELVKATAGQTNLL